MVIHAPATMSATSAQYASPIAASRLERYTAHLLPTAWALSPILVAIIHARAPSPPLCPPRHATDRRAQRGGLCGTQHTRKNSCWAILFLLYLSYMRFRLASSACACGCRVSTSVGRRVDRGSAATSPSGLGEHASLVLGALNAVRFILPAESHIPLKLELALWHLHRPRPTDVVPS